MRWARASARRCAEKTSARRRRLEVYQNTTNFFETRGANIIATTRATKPNLTSARRCLTTRGAAYMIQPSLHQPTCLRALEQQHLASIRGSSVLRVDRRGRKLGPSSNSPHHGPASRLGARSPATDYLVLGPSHPTAPGIWSSCAKGKSSSEGSTASRRSGGDSMFSSTSSANPRRSQAGTDRAASCGL